MYIENTENTFLLLIFIKRINYISNYSQSLISLIMNNSYLLSLNLKFNNK